MALHRAAGQRPLPEVSAENKAVREALENLFRAVRDNRPYKAAFVDAVRASSASGPEGIPRIDVRYEGQRLSFSYGGQAPFMIGIAKGDDGVKQVFHTIHERTNERYGEALEEAVSYGVKGVTRYVGILGGLDGPLAQIGYLQRDNPLAGVTLVDSNAGQIAWALAKMFEYDISEMAGVRSSPLFRALSEAGHYPGNGIMIDVVHGELEQHVPTITQQGKHFIYLSNAFTMPIFSADDMEWPTGTYPHFSLEGWSGLRETGRLMRQIKRSNAIREDSIVMFAAAASSAAMMLQKDSISFRLVALIGELMLDGSEATNITGFVRRYAQEAFLTSMVMNDGHFRGLRNPHDPR